MKKNENKLAGSHVMVTGGCGFIGSNLVERLIKLDVGKITVLDSLEYGSKKNLGPSERHVDIIKHQLGKTSDKKVSKILKDVDYLFHLAAEKHNQSINRPRKVLESNIDGTYNLFEAAARSGVKKVIYSSSLYVYGRRNSPPMIESEIPKPKTIYGISKLVGEHFLAHFHKKYGLKYNVLRYFFVYGPKQYSGTGYKSVIVKNFERIIKNKPPIIFGDGKQILDYIYVDDVVTATILAMKSSLSNEIFNVGSSIPTTIYHLTDTMLKISGKSLNKIYEAPDETLGSFRVANIEKIAKLLGFRPKVSLEDGLEKTYEWMKGEMSNEL